VRISSLDPNVTAPANTGAVTAASNPLPGVGRRVRRVVSVAAMPGPKDLALDGIGALDAMDAMDGMCGALLGSGAFDTFDTCGVPGGVPCAFWS
jgi:hypothetical protein